MMSFVDLNIHRKKANIQKLKGSIREYADYIEYLIIDKYDDKYSDFHCHCVSFSGLFAQILEERNRLVLVSIIFPKEKFDHADVLNWLLKFNIHFDKSKIYKIGNAEEVVTGLLFRGYPLVLYSKGNKILTYNPGEFPEVTEKFKQLYNRICNTALSREYDPGDLQQIGYTESEKAFGELLKKIKEELESKNNDR